MVRTLALTVRQATTIAVHCHYMSCDTQCCICLNVCLAQNEPLNYIFMNICCALICHHLPVSDCGTLRRQPHRQPSGRNVVAGSTSEIRRNQVFIVIVLKTKNT